MTDNIPREEISLYELNSIVKNAIKACFPVRYWIRAELSEVRENYSGHCYVEFIEKDKRNSQIIAKAKGQIWANRWALIKPYFEKTTGERFDKGLNVMVEVSVEFHELYGYSLTVSDIDPNYTLGDMARIKTEIIERLSQEGVLEMNKELELTDMPCRIAVISSSTAAGYEDFMNQLDNNDSGFKFYTHLFPAVMQGNYVEKSIIESLNEIYSNIDLFDVVVLIRGGGATSELSAFNSYDLALNITQFPIPVIVGIGHERDESVLDIVAHTRVKTPTAAAEFLISKMQMQADILSEIERDIYSLVTEKIEKEKNKLLNFEQRLPLIVNNHLLNERNRLQMISGEIRFYSNSLVNNDLNRIENIKSKIIRLVNDKLSAEKNKLNLRKDQIPHLLNMRIHSEELKLGYKTESLKSPVLFRIEKQRNRLNNIDTIIELFSPQNIVKKGYSITLLNGKCIRDASEIKKGDKIMSVFENGSVESQVKNIDKENIF